MASKVPTRDGMRKLTVLTRSPPRDSRIPVPVAIDDQPVIHISYTYKYVQYTEGNDHQLCSLHVAGSVESVLTLKLSRKQFSCGQSEIKGRKVFLMFQSLIAFFQGGVIPDDGLYVSY